MQPRLLPDVMPIKTTKWPISTTGFYWLNQPFIWLVLTSRWQLMTLNLTVDYHFSPPCSGCCFKNPEKKHAIHWRVDPFSNLHLTLPLMTVPKELPVTRKFTWRPCHDLGLLLVIFRVNKWIYQRLINLYTLSLLGWLVISIYFNLPEANHLAEKKSPAAL